MSWAEQCVFQITVRHYAKKVNRVVSSVFLIPGREVVALVWVACSCLAQAVLPRRWATCLAQQAPNSYPKPGKVLDLSAPAWEDKIIGVQLLRQCTRSLFFGSVSVIPHFSPSFPPLPCSKFAKLKGRPWKKIKQKPLGDFCVSRFWLPLYVSHLSHLNKEIESESA